MSSLFEKSEMSAALRHLLPADVYKRQQQFNTAKRPAVFEEQHRAELTAYRAAAAYFKANDITTLPSPKKLRCVYETELWYLALSQR